MKNKLGFPFHPQNTILFKCLSHKYLITGHAFLLLPSHTHSHPLSLQTPRKNTEAVGYCHPQVIRSLLSCYFYFYQYSMGTVDWLVLSHSHGKSSWEHWPKSPKTHGYRSVFDTYWLWNLGQIISCHWGCFLITKLEQFLPFLPHKMSEAKIRQYSWKCFENCEEKHVMIIQRPGKVHRIMI